ncbi:RNA-guided endonuclease InsQ/TnpB family protein [Streptomyces acidiscabies]|uniref:Transposase n=1 Tax=Streptomyces acidiscabies TaxID=42234 RepID=A0AAP6EJB6_9ACTN|nr:RNA-guided endonuclease TnpB family protein [Streptomyces acidiscabies]MBP5937437.1 transposase [Streptomyces sp. LBUM 1476]MBZ3914488.1 transposase [Streptomyces acidiscabies]MDX2964355.1 transposase [Streptomyces acidiscabies]MDX3017176.1 transposase [Streptomyces acidiscabies]MDX3789127.1 transposase [Streptomyces acidiscabies]
MATPKKVSEDTGHARYTYRLRVSSTARTALLVEWDRCRWVWNECVAKSRAVHAHNRAHSESRLTCGPAQLDRMLTEARARTPWLREGASVPQQQIIRDFARSRSKALKDVEKRLPMRQRAGMPRHKKKREALPTLNYTQRGFRLKDGRLHLAGDIVLTVVWSRELPSVPSSVRVYRDAVGHWYASFVVATETQLLPDTGRVLGVDWGVRETATTTSDAYDLPHPQHGRTTQGRLTRYDRMVSRRKPARGQALSKGYRDAKRWRANTYAKIARQRQDTARKWAKRVVRDHDAIAVENFRPKFLAKTTMARKAADAAIGATKKALIEMGRKHGRDVRLVNPAHTTMDCASCGARTKHALPLSERTYTCTTCGASSPRDKNSARVMLVRAGLTPAGAEGTRPAGAPLPQAA